MKRIWSYFQEITKVRFEGFRLIKFLMNTTVLLLLWLTWRFFTGQLGWGLALGTAGISGLWLVITTLRLRQLLTTYFDFMSRLQIVGAVGLGVGFSIVSACVEQHWAIYSLALLELCGWLYVCVLYRRQRQHYITQGHGPLPADCWVSPPAEAMEPFDVTLFSGRMAERVRDSVGHGEVTLRMPDGKMVSFSSLMEAGVVIRDLQEITSRQLLKGHYIVLRLQHPVTEALTKDGFAMAEKMLADNIQWRDATNARRHWFINLLPLPAAAKLWLLRKNHCTGYDWMGLFVGARADKRWTCVGAVLELLKRLGVKTNKYGTGLLGLGTGLLNPIMPVRFLTDPAFRLLTLEDKKLWEQSRSKRR